MCADLPHCRRINSYERLRCSPLSRRKYGLVKVEIERLSRGGKPRLPEIDLEGVR